MTLADDLRDLIEHDTAAARLVLEAMIAAAPSSVEALMLLANAHLRRLEFAEAAALAERVLTLKPDHDEALHLVGFCHLSTGALEPALSAYHRAFVTVSGARALRFIGLIQHRLGRTTDAAANYQRLSRSIQPTSPEIPMVLQGLTATLRDTGYPLLADHYAHQLGELFLRQPVGTSSSLVSRNNSEDFHEWSRLADKALLARAMTARLAQDAEGARVPETFVLPQDRAALAAFAVGPDAPGVYIVKPIRSSGGQGITLTAQVETALDRQDVVVQRYIDRPYLAEGRKGHARIYGLITSVDPLRAYVYGEGIVRFAPQAYDPDPAMAGITAMHVTNTALHLGHPDLKISTNPAEEDVGVIWSLSAYLRHMSSQGLDGADVFGAIKDLTTWFVRMLAAEGMFARQAASPARSFAPKLFGLDVLVDDQGQPWLIEMQRKPAASGQALVERINGAMYETIFRMSQSLLLDDTMPAAQVAAILASPQAITAREVELELAHLGQFVRLDV